MLCSTLYLSFLRNFLFFVSPHPSLCLSLSLPSCVPHKHTHTFLLSLSLYYACLFLCSLFASVLLSLALIYSISSLLFLFTNPPLSFPFTILLLLFSIFLPAFLNATTCTKVYTFLVVTIIPFLVVTIIPFFLRGYHTISSFLVVLEGRV